MWTEENRGHAYFDCFWFRLPEREANRHEVATDLCVVGEQRRQRHSRGDRSVGDLWTNDRDPDDLCDDRARSEDRREERQTADRRDDEQPDNVVSERTHRPGENIADAGVEDKTDQHGHERHERQNVAHYLINRLAAGVEEDADHLTHAAADRSDHIDKGVSATFASRSGGAARLGTR